MKWRNERTFLSCSSLYLSTLMSLVTRLSRTSTYSLLLLSATRSHISLPRSFTNCSSFNMSPQTPWDPSSTPYPKVHRSDTVEEFKSATKGTVKVADPYDWLSQPDSIKTKQFVRDQGEFTKKYLDQYEDKEKFSKELEKNWNYARCKVYLHLLSSIDSPL